MEKPDLRMAGEFPPTEFESASSRRGRRLASFGGQFRKVRAPLSGWLGRACIQGRLPDPSSVVDAACVQRVAGGLRVAYDAEHYRREPGAGVVLETARDCGVARLLGDLDGGGDAADHQ